MSPALSVRQEGPWLNVQYLPARRTLSGFNNDSIDFRSIRTTTSHTEPPWVREGVCTLIASPSTWKLPSSAAGEHCSPLSLSTDFHCLFISPSGSVADVAYVCLLLTCLFF